MLVSLIAFIVTIGILVSIHEWGHFRMARACGVKVLRFAIGFGPVIWSYQRSPQDTQYALCLLPLGGYVQMLNEGTTPINDPSAVLNADESYHTKPLWQRSLIVAAGPVINLLLAVLLFSFCFWMGVSEPVARIGSPAPATAAEKAGLQGGDLIHEICWANSECYPIRSLNELNFKLTEAALDVDQVELRVTSLHKHDRRNIQLPFANSARSNEETLDPQFLARMGLSQAYFPPVMGAIQPNGPAHRSGLQENDTIVRINGITIRDAIHARRLIKSDGIKNQVPVTMQWDIQRQGQIISLSITPRLEWQDKTPVPKIDAQLGGSPEMAFLQFPPLEASLRGIERTYDLSLLTVQMIGKMIMGEASMKNISGPVTIADFAGKSAQRGWSHYLLFLAMVSMSLGVINLLPIPMLDGGQLLYHGYEWIVGKPIAEQWQKRLQILGTIILGFLMVLGLKNDIFRLWGF